MPYYYLKKIIEYGLYLLVFLLPIQTRWIIKAGELNKGYWEYGTVSLYATDILLIFLLGLFLYTKIKSGESKGKSWKFSYWWIIAGLELIVFISIFFALEKGVAFFNYGRFLLGVGLFWLIIRANYSKVKLTTSILAGIFLQATFGIWQFLVQSSFACKWLGIAAHNASDLGVSVIETVGPSGIGERWLRAYGGLDHPNMLGGLLTVGLLLIILLFIKSCKINISDFKLFIVFNSLFLIFITALFFTFSRGAWVGLVIGIIVMLFKAMKEKNLWQQKKLLEVILISGILIFILFNQYENLVLTRFSNTTRLEMKSRIERVESYKTAQALIKKHWLFGVGIGNYTAAMQNEIIRDQPSYFYQPVHNVFLLILVEIGIVGFLFFTFFVIFVIVNFKKFANEKIAILLTLIIMMMVDHWWWSLHFGVLFLWLIMAMILRDKNI